jgi:mRNA interferase HigB
LLATPNEDRSEGAHKNHIISWWKIREFLETHPEHGNAERVFDKWYQSVRTTRFANFGDVRRLAATASPVGKYVVFNVGGNKFRVITEIFYSDSVILIRHVLTHTEYDDDKWKE